MNKKPIVLGIGEILWDLQPEGKQLGGATPVIPEELKY